MKSGPENHRVPRDHAVPTQDYHRDREITRNPDEPKQCKPDAVHDQAAGCYQEGPEVDAAVALEGGEAEDYQLDRVV